MNFSKFDVIMTVTMALAIISLSFVMPALGLTSADTEENDVPELDVNSNRFDFAGSFPDRQGTPARGTLTYDHDDYEPTDTRVDLDETTRLFQLETIDTSDPVMQVNLLETSTGNFSSLYFNESGVGDRQRVNDHGYTLDVSLADVQNRNSSDFEWTVRYRVVEEPSEDKGFLERIPLVGGVVGAGESLAQIIGWLGSIMWWGVATAYEIVWNTAIMIGQSMLFMIETANWLITTYADVVSAANSWAGLFVAIPGLILFLELAKAVMIGLSLMPTT